MVLYVKMDLLASGRERAQLNTEISSYTYGGMQLKDRVEKVF